jgi:hypothetical protein
MPTARIELRKRAQRQVAAGAVAVGGALQRGVVQQKGHAVGAQLGVAFEHAVAVLCAQAEGGQGVFRGQLASATVGNPAGVGRKRCAFMVQGRSVRFSGAKLEQVAVGVD